MSFTKGHVFYKGGEKGWFTSAPRPEKKTGKTVTCYCGKQKYFKKSILDNGGGKFCSKICANTREDKTPPWNKNQTGLQIAWNKGVIGEKSHSYKHTPVGYTALHQRMRKKLIKPDNCCKCFKKTSKLDLSNVSYQYLEDPADWEWLCRGCHNKKDWRNGAPASKLFNNFKERVTEPRILMASDS